MENNIDIHRVKARAMQVKLRSMAGFAAAKNAERIYESLIRQREVVGENKNEITVNIRMTVEDYGLTTKIGIKDVTWSIVIRYKDDAFWTEDINPNQLELPLEDGEEIEVDTPNENIVENALKWPPLKKDRSAMKVGGSEYISIYDLEAVAKSLGIDVDDVIRARYMAIDRLKKVADECNLRICWFTLGRGRIVVREPNEEIHTTVVIPEDELIAGMIDEYADAISIGENGLLPNSIQKIMNEGWALRRFDINSENLDGWMMVDAEANQSPNGYCWKEPDGEDISNSTIKKEIYDWIMNKDEVADGGWLLA